MTDHPVKRPNILVFVTDQHPGSWLACAGHPVVQTPHIDRIAAQGVRFDRAYTIHPLCMPTRSTWWTGQSPHAHGVRCNGIPLSRSVPTVTEALARSGYRTHSIGKIHMNPFWHARGADPATLDPLDWPEARSMWNAGYLRQLPTPYYGIQSADWMGANGNSGLSNYTQWLLQREPRGMELMEPAGEVTAPGRQESVYTIPLPSELHYTSWMAESAERFIAEQRNADHPFFLWWSCPNPHPPYMTNEPWASMYDPDDMPMPTRREGELENRPPHYRQFYEEGGMSAGRLQATKCPDDQIRRVRAMVCGMISQLDAAIGRVLQALEESGELENTVIVFMADHGQMLGDHWMGTMPPTHLDTLIRIPCIWSVPGGPQGAVSDALVSHLDFAPTILDLAGVAAPEGFTPPECEAPGARPALPGHSILPLVHGRADSLQDCVHVENDEDYMGLRIRTLVTHDWLMNVYIGEEYGELYDLRNDPEQFDNRWDDPALHTTRLELQSALLHRLAHCDATIPRRACHA